MRIPLKIAGRYFFSRKRSGSLNLISVISGISLLGYITGAAALIIVLSVFNGFENLFVSLYNNFDADIQITASSGKSFDEKRIDFNALGKMDGVNQYAKVLEENVLLKYGDRQGIATAKGVDPRFLSITSLDSCMVSGEKMIEKNGQGFALVGQGIAYQLAIDPHDLFNRLIFYVPDRTAESSMDIAGSFRQDALYPAGTFTVQQEVDDQYVLAPIAFIRNLINKPGQISSVEIQLNDKSKAGSIIRLLKEKYPESIFSIKNRFEQREAFFKVMESEKLISYFILFFILLIAASNTIGSLFILVLEKQKDIRMLSSIGLPKSKIGSIFIMEGILQAIVGGGIGLLLGLGLCVLQEKYGFVKLNEAAVFMFQAYPVKIKALDILLVFGTVMFLGILTSIYPARRAMKSAL